MAACAEMTGTDLRCKLWCKLPLFIVNLFHMFISSFLSFLHFSLVSSGWRQMAAGCGGLAEGGVTEPLHEHASYGKVRLNALLGYHT